MFMKKNSLVTLIMSIMLAGMMTLVFCGCGGSEEAEEETTITQTEAESGETDSLLEDPEYDISVILANAGLEELLDAMGVEYSINKSGNTSNEVSIDTGGDEYDGVVGTFMAYTEGDNEYENIPDYRIIGMKDGVVYVLMLPTDLRYNPEDSRQCGDYEKLTEVLKTFEIK